MFSSFQSDVESGHGDILKLGLIHGRLNAEEASTEEQPKWLTYAHKLFHDCLAGYHISRKVFTYFVNNTTLTVLSFLYKISIEVYKKINVASSGSRTYN